MRGSEHELYAFIDWASRVFLIPMRGSEMYTPARAIMKVLFLIPMRGSEMVTRENAAAVRRSLRGGS